MLKKTFTWDEGTYPVTSIYFLNQNKLLVTHSCGTIKVWDLGLRTERVLAKHEQKLPNTITSTAIVYQSDFLANKMLATASEDNTIKIWDIATGKLLKEISRKIEIDWLNPNWIKSLAFSPDGQILVTGSDDLQVWNIEAGKSTSLPHHSNWIRSLAFSPDGQTLASGSDDNIIEVWDCSPCKTTSRMYIIVGEHAHKGAIHSLAFSPDSQILASGSYDDTVKLWDVNTGELLHTLTGHSNTVTSVTFSPDGRTLASAGLVYDQTIKLWDVATGEEINTLTGHSRSVVSISFSPDGKVLASASEDNTIKLWDVTL
jgi:WD40 repeat protein